MAKYYHCPHCAFSAGHADRCPDHASKLADAILAGDRPASDALGRPDLYDALNAGGSRSTFNRLPFLGTSSKIEAGTGAGVLTAVLYMQPANESGREACAGRSAGCTASCLAESTGRMSMSGPRTARRRRHASFYADRGRFLADLAQEVERHAARARRMGLKCAVRLNGTTDLPWHRMAFTDRNGRKWASIHEAFPSVNFYEYTKHALRTSVGRKGLPSNLSLTFSLSERDDAERKAGQYLRAGYGVAVVLHARKGEHPDTLKLDGECWPVVNGDEHDARFLDPASSVVALSAKGRAKSDTTGFVRHV